ncbi:MAG: hypothetical protein ACJ736_15655 [Streptomyces sp.]
MLRLLVDAGGIAILFAVFVVNQGLNAWLALAFTNVTGILIGAPPPASGLARLRQQRLDG